MAAGSAHVPANVDQSRANRRSSTEQELSAWLAILDLPGESKPTAEEVQRYLLNKPSQAASPEPFIGFVGSQYSRGRLVDFSVVKKSDLGVGNSQTPNLIDVSVSDKAKKFVDLPDALRRSLVPIIKVYKTFIDENGKQVDLRLRTDPSNNGVNRVDLERIDFIRKGGNPAEVDTNIEFNIKLSARELGFYFVKQYPKSEQGEEDLFTLERESKGVAWIDLIKIDPGRELQVGEVGNSELVINETDARMKVFLGYATPTIKPAGMDDNVWNDWKNIITSQQEVFYLNLYKHQFDFKPSGEVGLSIDFIASGNGRTLVPEADILLGPRYNQRLRDINKLIKDRKKVIRDLSSVDDALAERDSTYKECVERAAQTGSLDGLENQREHLINLSHNRLINQIELGYNYVNDAYYFPSHQQDPGFRRYTRLKNIAWQGDEDDEGKPARFLDYRYEIPESKQDCVSDYVYFGEIVEAAIELLANNRLLGEPDLDVNDVSDSNRSTYLNIVDNAPAKKFLTPFAKKEHNDARRLRTMQEYGGFILGNVNYEAPDGTNKQISLLELPISWEKFTNWWETKGGGKTVWFFRDFLTALVTDFLSEVFSDSVYGEASAANDTEKPKFSIVNISVSKEIVKTAVTDININTVDTSQFIELINAANNPPEQDAEDPTPASTDNDMDLSSLLLVQQVRDSAAVRTRHAPRLLWGQSTRGILESVSFQREDIPGYGEARIMSDRTAVANNMMLNEKYNTTLEMIGNTAFLPGCQLYLDPRPLDLGFADERGSYARSLGMGGLYIVNYIEHQMDFIEKSWKTTLDTKWESFGDGEAGDDVNIDRCLLESALRTAKSRASHLSMMAFGIRDQLQRDALYTPSTNDPTKENYDAESREEYREMREEYIRLHEEIDEIEEQLNSEEPEDS